MDPVTLIVVALGAGALAGAKDAASSAVTDAYASLRELLKRRFAGKQNAELVLARHQGAPQTWKAPLETTLKESGIDRDQEVIAAAQALMALLDAGGTQAGKYTVDLQGAQGVQIGDRGRQVNVFNPPALR